ncbi:hypothetical protein ECC02_001386 [Trypanosoma cruzi]|uniref:Protein kinase domain-containing protein n=1 Tax=Trypanosoma cruzi TaxID=5693 RepID=A0A7J6YG74_TRYCR|nr:hypothetical protein ECC02_001386 [Trypanosoma cruzi]
MDRSRSEGEKPRVFSRTSTQSSSVFGSSNSQFPMGLGIVEVPPDSKKQNGVSGFQLKKNNGSIRPPTGNEEIQILSFSPTSSSAVSTRPCGPISSSKTTDGQASVHGALFLRQAFFSPIRSPDGDRGIHSDTRSNEPRDKSKQKIADGDVMMSSSPLANFSGSSHLPKARPVDGAAIAVKSEFAPSNPGRDELEIKRLLPNVKSSSETPFFSPAFSRFSTGENYMGSSYMRDEVDTAAPNITLRHYILSRPKPAVRGRGLYRRLYFMLISLVLLPFVFIALLFGLHYWASTNVAEELHHYAGASLSDDSFCDRNFLELQHRQIGPISKEGFICVMGILLALIIIVIGGAFILWLFSWRCVILNYLQTLEFIRRAAPMLTQIEPLGPEQLAGAPKPVPSFFFWHCNRGENNKKEVLSQGIVEKVVLLGDTLNELKKYIPSTVQSDVISAVLAGHSLDSSTAVSTMERKGGRTSGPSPPQEDVLAAAGDLNPLQIKVQAHSPLSVKKKAATFTGGLCRSHGSGNHFGFTQTAGQRGSSNKLSPPHRRFMCPARSLSSLILSTSSSVTLTAENERALQPVGNRGECAVSEAAETRITMLNDYGFSLQQTTFLVCRLFLPKLELNSDASVIRDSVNQVREMSQRFLRIVLRVAKEENGFSFNICLDSVIVVFYTPSGTNCVNLFQPRNCALRLVSELSKLESEWAAASSTPLNWGIAMHMSLLMIGVSDIGSHRFAYLYGEELQLAYRVAELCMILHCPLIMLQSCYDLFRVCMMAVPVDVICRETIRGKDRIYLYELKIPEEGEDLDTKREYYKPLTVAFGLMCGRQFADAAKKLAGIVEMDHNVSRLLRLCEYFLQMQEKGTINTILSSTENYVRKEPRWEPLESKAVRFLDKYCVREKQQCIHRRREVSGNNEGNEENVTRDYHAARFFEDGHEVNGLRSEKFSETHIRTPSVRCDSITEADDFFYSSNTPSELNPSFAVPMSPVIATHDAEVKRTSTIPLQSICDPGEPQQVRVRYISRSTAASVTFSEVDSGNKAVPHHWTDVHNLQESSKNDGGNEGSKYVFDVYEPLGRGTFSTVYRGLHPNGNIVAVKKYPFRDRGENNSWAQSVRFEIEMLSSLRHKNVVRYISSFFQDEYLYIIAEFVSGGSLSAIVRTFRRLPYNTIRRYTGDILRGLQYLHKRQVVHRDISPNNVLVNIDGVCKLSNFGGAVVFAMQRNEFCSNSSNATTAGIFAPRNVVHTSDDSGSATGTVILKNCFGTPACMSPEACSGVVDPKNDIWALGITLCFCFSGRFPWPEEELNDVNTFVDKVRRGVLSPQVPFDMMDSQAADFISLCLRRNTSSRPSATELLFHLFVVG